MRRADRLFQIVQLLRGGRRRTAKDMAAALEVSTRTIYRDIADLQASGVPVEGEAGFGYVMQGGYEVPPLMFTTDEILALVAGARLLEAWGGENMARAAQEALLKIDAVLPEAGRARAEQVQVYALAPEFSDTVRRRLDALEAAIQARQILTLHYTDQHGVLSERQVHPLGLWFWGKVWTLVCWCRLREDFRVFRVDRIATMDVGTDCFVPRPDRSLSVFVQAMKDQGYLGLK